MVAIIIRHIVGVFYTHYTRYLASLSPGQPAVLGRSSSSVHSRQATNNRKNGHTRPKRYNDLAKHNSIVFKPLGSKEKKKNAHGEDHDAIDSGPKSTNKAQLRRASQGRGEPRPDSRRVAEHKALVQREFKALQSTKAKVEKKFKAKITSEQMKAQITEGKAKSKEEKDDEVRRWRMQELERREEKDRSDRFKETRLAQLEKDAQAAGSALAREKLERKQSRLRMAFAAQEERHKMEERWEQLRAENARLVSERQDKLQCENAALGDNLRVVDAAFQQVCGEREQLRQKMEEERTKRLRAEGSLDRWKEQAKECLPGGPPEQPPTQEQELPQQQPPRREPIPPVKAQLELYEGKWGAIQSGVDNSGSKVGDICFSQMPWPVVDIFPTNPSEIRPGDIEEFITHPLRGQFCGGWEKTTRMKAIDELKKWHPERFNHAVLPMVWEPDRQAVSEAAGIITGVLTAMLLVE